MEAGQLPVEELKCDWKTEQAIMECVEKRIEKLQEDLEERFKTIKLTDEDKEDIEMIQKLLDNASEMSNTLAHEFFLRTGTPTVVECYKGE